MYDNADNLPKDYIESMERKPEWWKRWFVYPCWEPLAELAGEPVFEGHFDYDLHVSDETLQPWTGWPITRGWDVPGPIATVWFQVSQNGKHCRVLYEQQAEAGASIADVKQAVLSNSATLFPKFSYSDYGDPAAFTMSPTDQKTCADILRPEVILQPGEKTITARLEAGRMWMDKLADGQPALQIDPRCRLLIGALAGGFAWKQVAGQLLPEPQKNSYSHITDAWLHALARVTGLTPMKRRELMGPVNFGPELT
jgi:hypothetical protein